MVELILVFGQEDEGQNQPDQTTEVARVMDIGDTHKCPVVDYAKSIENLVPRRIVCCRASPISVEESADAKGDARRKDYSKTREDFTDGNPPILIGQHATREDPSANEPHPPGGQKSNARNKNGASETEIGPLELLEFEVDKVFGADGVSDLVVDNSIASSNQ